MIELHIDFEGKYGLRPYGLDYNWLSGEGLTDVVRIIREFAIDHPEIIIKIFFVGALLANKYDYESNLEAASPYLHSYDAELLQNFWMESPLSLENNDLPSNVFIGSHTYFHISAQRINRNYHQQFYMLDQSFMDQVFVNVSAQRRCGVVFPENVVPSCADEIFVDYRPGFKRRSILNAALHNINTTLLFYKDSNRPFFKNELLRIYRPLTMMLNRSGVFYTHCHNIITDPSVLRNFCKYISLKS